MSEGSLKHDGYYSFVFLVETQTDSKIFFLWKCIVLLKFCGKNWQIISKLNSNTVIKNG